jgi:hypothetical protein
MNGSSSGASFLIECFWPGVTEAAHVEADRRLRRAAGALEVELGSLVYLGSVLMPEDEVVLLQFETADPELCRLVAQRAGVDHERVLRTVCLPAAGSAWPRGAGT